MVPDSLDHPLPAPPADSYRWSPLRQRRFLEHFAATGSVTLAARYVGVSVRAAYYLRQRRDGMLFALGWNGAVLLARQRLTDILLEWAVEGVDEVRYTTSNGRGGHESHSRRRNGRVGMDLLARLDRMAQPASGTTADEALLARLVAQDFETFLDRLCPPDPADSGLDETGEADGFDPAALRTARINVAAHLLAAAPAAHPLGALCADTPLQCELARKSAASGHLPAPHSGAPNTEAAHTETPLPPEARAERMTVWRVEQSGALRTDFPPPPGFTGWESGTFGLDGDYARALDPAETAIVEARLTVAQAELAEEGAVARAAWFDAGSPGHAICPLPVTRRAPDSATSADGNHGGRRVESLDALVERLRSRVEDMVQQEQRERERAFCQKYGVAIPPELAGDAPVAPIAPVAPVAAEEDVGGPLPMVGVA